MNGVEICKFMCKLCHHLCCTKSGFYKHFVRCHCTECDFSGGGIVLDDKPLTSKQRSLEKIIKEERYKCDDCGNCFHTQYNLNLHIVASELEITINCIECQNNFETWCCFTSEHHSCSYKRFVFW